jgi:CHASE1-domain containing sensor protein
MTKSVSTNFGGRLQSGAPTLIVGFVGIAATIAVWYLTLASEKHAFEQEFSGRANNQLVLLQNGLDQYWDRVEDVRAFFDSSDNIPREAFESFSNALLNGHPAILNVAWIPRVKQHERLAHEHSAARDGLAGYRIRAVVPDGSLPVAPDQDEYFPKFYSTEARTSPVYGLDLNDGGMRQRVLNHVRDANVLSTSSGKAIGSESGPRCRSMRAACRMKRWRIGAAICAASFRAYSRSES